MIGMLLMGLVEASVSPEFARIVIIDPPKGIVIQDPEEISDWDYPQEVLKENASGTAVVRLGLGTDGAINRCDVVATSGNKALDKDTCAGFMFGPIVATTDGSKLPFTIDARVTWTPPPLDHPTRARVSADIFSDDDYPTDAIAEGAQGIVKVELDLDRQGKVTACTIAKTSGHASLDTKTCEIFVERGRATMVGSKNHFPATMTSRVRWVLPEGIYFGDWFYEVRVRTAGNEGEVSCTEVNGEAAREFDSDQCLAITSVLSSLRDGAPLSAKGGATFGHGLIQGTDLDGVESKMFGTILVRSAARISVNDSGQVIACEEVKPTEWKRAAPAAEIDPLCTTARSMRFESRDKLPSSTESGQADRPEGTRQGVLFEFATHADAVIDS